MNRPKRADTDRGVVRRSADGVSEWRAESKPDEWHPALERREQHANAQPLRRRAVTQAERRGNREGVETEREDSAASFVTTRRAYAPRPRGQALPRESLGLAIRQGLCRQRAGRIERMAAVTAEALLRRGLTLEYLTLAWNVVGTVVLGYAALAAGSVALAGFGLDLLIEIAASTVVVWQLKDIGASRERPALRLIGVAFVTLALYIAAEAAFTLIAGHQPGHSTLGIAWTGVTCALMLALAAGKARIGEALDNRVLQTEGRVTLIDAYLAAAVLIGLVFNAALGWWWADPLAGLVIVYFGLREGVDALRPTR
ncbi:MAG TPA: cation transporter [Solirubrobacteraceae bacterium]